MDLFGEYFFTGGRDYIELRLAIGFWRGLLEPYGNGLRVPPWRFSQRS